jgi:GNAT superfamily N-acetyltransferase
VSLSSPPITIRRASRADAPRLLELVDALADYERLARPDAAARERLVRDGFATDPPLYEAYLIELDGRGIAYAVAFQTYSSFLARPTLYLEDLFVLPEHRRKGIGETVMRFLAEEALRRGCGRMEWMVLTWNETAIRFYARMAARRLDDWVAYRLTREDLARLAGEDPGRSAGNDSRMRAERSDEVGP